VIQFELYRFLMNSIASEKQFGAIRYRGVEPEVPARSGSADLVVQAEIDGSPTNIFVISAGATSEWGSSLESFSSFSFERDMRVSFAPF
jgi:hypothetical protein